MPLQHLRENDQFAIVLTRLSRLQTIAFFASSKQFATHFCKELIASLQAKMSSDSTLK